MAVESKRAIPAEFTSLVYPSLLYHLNRSSKVGDYMEGSKIEPEAYIFGPDEKRMWHRQFPGKLDAETRNVQEALRNKEIGYAYKQDIPGPKGIF